MNKEKLKSHTFGVAIAGFTTAVFGGYMLDKSTDFSLQVSFDRGRAAAAERAEIISSIRSRFQTTGIIENDPNFPLSTGIEELTSAALPRITDNIEAQTALSKCETKRSECVAPVRGNCLTPRHAKGLSEMIKRETHDKLNFIRIRECSTRVLECEKALKQCIENDILPMSATK
jgi:hypothetical protein